jgi:phosphoserine aminotransferase
MRKVFNFGAGPAMLPEEVLLKAQAEMLDWQGTGVSVMELGHRGPEFKVVAEQTEADLRELMNIPQHYRILFLAGGASIHFAMVPLNLLNQKKRADYIDTGIWSKKAIEEAKRYGNIQVAAHIERHHDLLRIPSQSSWTLDPEASYVHYTPNETIEGIEFQWIPETADVPLVADMTSMILSRPIDVNRFGVIYAGAQKNLGQAGITVVIIRDDLIRKPLFSEVPTLYQYAIHAEHHSFYNTPPTYAWYLMGLMLAWMKKQGGVNHFAKINQRKAEKIYAVIDSHSDFYTNPIDPSSRSLMNIPFNLKNDALIPVFLEDAKKEGLAYLKGHRIVGGMRASVYNPMPEEGVDALVDFMKAFAKQYG